jgi:insulysin
MAVVIEKSVRESREYKFFTLDNNIKCLVVSDPEAEHSAASMNVHIGSVNEEIEGLAHFLEHMLFMGTEKYPKENEYNNFLNANAGYSNAFTANENTNYFFKVSSDQLYHALEIFSQFFIAPLFNEDSIERELKAVDSEYNKNLLDDNWRIYQIIRNSCSKPYNHFGSGNNSTLNIPGIRDRVIEFYNKYYSANLMSLVIYGKENPDTLTEWAYSLFSTVPNKGIVLPVYEKPKFESTMTLTKVIPIKNTKILKLLWILPSQIEHFSCKPDGYIGHLLGHEGKNSLLSYLKHENLAEELMSNHEDTFSSCSYIFVDIKLTDKGLENYEYILEIVYAYINYLQTHPPQEWIFEELKSVAYSEFTYRSKQDPFWYVQKLSSRLERYPPAKVLSGPELYDEFDGELIKEMIKYLDYTNLQIYLLSQSLDKSEMVEETWYKTLHSKAPFTEQLISRLQSPSIDVSQKQLSYPLPNPYITTGHTLLDPGTDKLPREILKNEHSRAWHKQDSKYRVDKVQGQVMIYCNSCRFDTSAYCFSLAELWNKLLKETIREENYLAELSGLKNEIEIDNHGVRITVNGFSEKFSRYFEYLVEKVAQFQPTEADHKFFDDAKSEFLLKLKNRFYSKPYEQAQRILYDANLIGGYFNLHERIKAIENIEFQDVLWFSTKWLKNVYFEWLVIGNISAEVTASMVNSCTSLFLSTKSPSFMQHEEFLVLNVTKIPENTDTVFKSMLEDPKDTNSAVISQWQMGPETFNLQAILALFENYLNEPCFNILRTQEQLGYIVSSYPHKIRGILNFMVLIQSSVKCPLIIFDRITEFIKQMQLELIELDDQKYEKIVKSSLEGSFKKDLSLEDEYRRFKFEVDSGAYCFDRRKKVKACIKKITKQEMQKAFDEVFLEKPRRLNIEMVSAVMNQEEIKLETKSKIYNNLSDFKRNHSNWPQVYIRK